MKFKRFIRYTAAALLCVLLLGALGDSAGAIVTVNPPVGTTGITVTPGIEMQDPTENTQGRRATRVRRYASFSAADIGSFEDGTRITVLGEEGSFYKVDCFDMKGYVAKSQVREENGECYVNCIDGSTETKFLPVYSVQNALTLRDAIQQEARKHLGIPYLRGGTNRRGFDCSGYTMYVFQKVGKDISRSLVEQMAAGVIVAKSDLQCGDLIIFSNTGTHGSFASHIGIYIGNNQVIHASYSRGIAINDLDSDYYTRHYQCARRVVLTELAPTVTIPAADIFQSGSHNGWRSGN